MMMMRINIPVAYYVALIFCLVTTSCKVAHGYIGVTWGRQSYQRLIPSMVVDLILQNNVHHARIYSGQDDMLVAFSGSNIDLTVGIYKPSEYDTELEAQKWVFDKMGKYHEKVNIRRVFIGNYVFKNNLDNHEGRQIGIDSLHFIQKVLNDQKYGYVKASLTFSYNEITPNGTRPSDAHFNPELLPDIKRVLDILKENNSSFVVQIFPAQFANDNNKDLAFAYVDNKNSSLYVYDDTVRADYTNAFEFVYDSFVWALEKAGAPDIPLIVDQACWATDGLEGANLKTAEQFFKGLLPWAASEVGTHKRPGKPIDVYVHSLFDETIVYAKDEPYARHWGIYRSNGVPKYKIDLTGHAQDVLPVQAKGIMRMPKRWCVLKDGEHDQGRLDSLKETICNVVDCTSLLQGGSCSNLSPHKQMSYRFNVYFQSYFQKESDCDNEGMGEVITDDPSEGECVFTVEVVEGEQNNFESSAAHPMFHVFFMLLISIFWAALTLL